MSDVPLPNTNPSPNAEEWDDDGYQGMIEAEDVDVFVHSQTTRRLEKYKKDLDEIKRSEKTIHRFVMNGEKNRFLNVPTYDEVLDPNDKDFYVNANSLKTPYGNFLLSQAPNSSTRGDFYHLLWIFNVRTIVSLVNPEKGGGYFDPNVGGKVTVLFKYSLTTLNQFDVDGVKVFQVRMKAAMWSMNSKSERIVYIIVLPTALNGPRNTRMHLTAMEQMWVNEEASQMTGDGPTTVLVHGISGTRRTSAFVAAAIMCKQVMDTGKFSAMDTWVEIRKRRCGAASRKQDFFSALITVFEFSVTAGLVSHTDDDYTKSIEVLKAAVTKDAEYYAKDDEG